MANPKSHNELKHQLTALQQELFECKNKQNSLAITAQTYLSLFDAANDAIFIHDAQDGHIIEVNQKAVAGFGYTKEELLELNISAICQKTSPYNQASFQNNLQRAAKGEALLFEWRAPKKNGDLFWIEVTLKKAEFDGRQRIVSIARDISTRKQIEKEKAELQTRLNQSQKLESIGRLAGGVAHDLNNLLSPILGYCEMLMEDTDNNAVLQEKLNAIYQAGQGARSLVGQLLAFSRKQTLDFHLVDVDKVLMDFKRLLCRTIREDIHIQMISSAGKKTIRADQNQLEQIIMNLSVNAADAMPDGGTLTIKTDIARLDETYTSKRPGIRPGHYVSISFMDTGHGMDKDTCSKIFEPFYSTKGKQGTGLGLATVYGIVKQHQGNIWVYSEISKGSVFKVYLPYTSTMNTEVDTVQAPVRDLNGTETILLAEDNDEVRRLTAQILTAKGYTVLAAKNGNSALETWAASDQFVHLLVTDVIMPEMNGKELFAALTSMDKGIKALYMSGYPDDAIAHHGVIDEGTPFIQKPFNKKEFLLKIRQVLDDKI